MASGVCSVVKTRPRRVRRSVSDASINVQGAVVMKKVWMFEDGQLNSGDNGHADKLSIVDEPGASCQHHWFLTTNLASAQSCPECNRRIRMRQAAYKCTDCKRVAHLKCAAVTTEEKRGRKTNACTPNRARELINAQNITRRNRVMPINVKIDRKPVTPPGIDRQPFHQIDNMPDRTAISQTNSLDSLAEMYIQDGKMNSSSQTESNTTIQSRCKQTLDCMKQTFKRRCRSFRKKSKSFRNKKTLEADLAAPCDKQEEVTVDNDSTEVKVPLDDCGGGEDGPGLDARAAWVRSPIRNRLRSRQMEIADETRANADHMIHPRKRIRVTAHKRRVRQQKYMYQANTFDLELLKDRLGNVEQKVRELETAIPEEMAEWRKLKLKFQDHTSLLPMTMKTDNFTSETSEQREMTLSQEQPSSSTSDEVFVVPEGTASSSSNGEQGVLDPGLCGNYDSLTTMPSSLPNSLKYVQTSENFDHQTSTPVTNREMSFRSASKNYELSQVTHTNVTRISIGNSTCENQSNKRVGDVDVNAKRKSAKFETTPSPEKSVLSPNQLAVKSFLEKRKRLSSPGSGSSMLNQSGSLGSRSANHSDICNSPPVASSTLRNGEKSSEMFLNSDVSALSFTVRNDPENSHLSYAKLFLDGSKIGKKDFDRQCSNASALSYTLRNDSSMMPMVDDEDLPAFYRNVIKDDNTAIADSHVIRNNSDLQYCRSTSIRFENVDNVDSFKDTVNTDHKYCRNPSVRFENIEHEADDTGEVDEMDCVPAEQVDMETAAGPPTVDVTTKCNTTMATTTTDGLSLTNITEFTGEFLDSLRDFDTNAGAASSTASAVLASRDANPISAPSYECSSISQDTGKSDSFLTEVKDEIDAHFNKLHKEMFGCAGTDAVCKEKHDDKVGETKDFHDNFVWTLEAWKDRELKRVDERGDGKPPVPVVKEKNSQFTNIGRKLKEMFNHTDRAQLSKKVTEKNDVVQKQEDGVVLKKLDRKLNHVFNFAAYPEFEDDVLDKSSVKDMEVQDSGGAAVGLEVGVGHEASSESKCELEYVKDIPKPIVHNSSQKFVENSTHEFEEIEKHFQDESLALNGQSVNQARECMTDQRMDHWTFGKAKSCSTNSMDGISHDYSKYHFLHEKGMIKIRSPSLKLVSESPMEKRKYCPESSDIDEGSDTAESSSDLGGFTIDDEFQSHAGRKSGKGSLCSGLTEIKSSMSSLHTAGTSKEAPYEKAEHEMFEQCLQIVDENQQKWNDVISWMNQECGYENLGELEDELGLLVTRSADEKDETNQESNSPVDDSVYYSFRGQSDELRNILSAVNGGTTGCLMDAILNGSTEDVESLLFSDTTISESEIKEAVHWSIEQRNRPITRLLLNDICQLLVGSEGDDVVDAWPAYRDNDPWKPVFVVLVTKDCQGFWDEFMDFDVFRRRYDLVSPEATNVVNNKLVSDNPLSLDVFEAVTKVIDSARLHEKHKKLTVVNACPCRSKDGGTIIERGLCIVVHCLVKGLIPFDEQPFPTRIGEMPVDVREGYFTLGMDTRPAAGTWPAEHGDSRMERGDSAASFTGSAGSCDGSVTASSMTDGVYPSLGPGGDGYTSRHRKLSNQTSNEMDLREELQMRLDEDPNLDVDHADMLKATTLTSEHEANSDMATLEFGTRSTDINTSLLMGTSIGPSGQYSRGTLGGFVRLSDGTVAALTCAHVLGLHSRDQEISQPAYRHTQGQDAIAQSVVGEVVRIVRDSGACGGTGVDAALVRIDDRPPVDGQFVSVSDEQLTAAGFNPVTPPIFNRGKVQPVKDITPDKRHTSVFKFGAETGLTRGSIYVSGIYVRSCIQATGKADDLDNHHMSEFFNQMEVLPTNGCASFFDLGDSGALVFMPLDDGEWHCIGLAVGCTSYGSCVVTPIENVFDKLGLPAEFIDFTNY